ncbi:MAG: RNase adapter RapZ [Firmicutes bacterium]|nr:RNase adapter RapZ [Bacillota bacterium]MBR3211924.1 RNase adapter RapZ [Bacillota bacterium]
MDKMEAVLITGLSGAGKTSAMEWFEDQGYYCVDNMPPALIQEFIDLGMASKKRIAKAAFACDVRGGEFFDELKECISRLRKREDVRFRVLFLEASERALVKRYNETRRNHPLAAGPVTREVITTEKARLKEIRDLSEIIIDTTNMKVSGLKAEIDRVINAGGDSGFTLNLCSFGYKRGLPQEADLVFDMRFIPNPYYLPSLRPLTGKNKKVSNYVLKQEVTKEFIAGMKGMLEKLIPGYIRESKYHLNIAFGCTGGHHRSVAVAEEIARLMKDAGYRVTLEHRDL